MHRFVLGSSCGVLLGLSLAGGDSRQWCGGRLALAVLLSLHIFISLVGADVDQRGNMADVRVLQRLAACVQRGYGKLDSAAVDLRHERLLVEIAKVLLADFF